MKLTFFGDAVIQNDKKLELSDSITDLIKKSDFNVVNFEGSLKTDSAEAISKIGPNVFNSSEAVSNLRENGFNIFTLANNHICDFGLKGFEATIDCLKKNDIKFCGAGFDFESAYKPLILEKNGEKIALINACHAEFGVFKDSNIPLNCGYAWINNREIKNQIVECKKNGCFAIVVPHAGVEFQPVPLPEWREIYRSFIDSGADIVIGGHPHTVQGMETYKGKSIYYSLGNFYFHKEEKKDDADWNHGMIVSVDTDNKTVIENFTISTSGKVSEDDSSEYKSRFLERSAILKDEKKYYELTNSLEEKLWNQTYKPLYESVPNFIDCRHGLIKNLLKYFAKKLIFKNRFQKDLNETLLLHNIQIESHRYAVERYLYLRNCQKNGLLKQELSDEKDTESHN